MSLKDIIYGVAIGDSMGVPVEFIERNILDKNPVTKMIGNGTHKQEKGTFSDDTSLTLCLLDGINFKNHKIDEYKVCKNMINWLNKGLFTTDGRVFDVGNTTFRAIDNMIYGLEPFDCGIDSIRQNGNGALMRISPLLEFLKDEENINIRFEITKNICSLTHSHIINILGCFIYEEYGRNILNLKEKEKTKKIEILDKTIDEIKPFIEENFDKETIFYYKNILDKNIENLKRDEISSNGSVFDSLNASIWCFVTNNSFESSILCAVNLGNDTDTIGAITGSLSGIFYGYDSIPKEWIEDLRRKDILDKIIKEKEG